MFDALTVNPLTLLRLTWEGEMPASMPLFPDNTYDSKAREALRRHINSKWESQAAFARAADIPERAVAWYLKGRSIPSLRHAVLIERKSGGAVRCVDWVEH